jgi:catechol 2,3-dioxygenase-like lactoylglutathione lyase family enzyme
MANLTHIWPCFIVTDVKVSVAFYADKLGFKVRYLAPEDDPFFAIVGRDDIAIMLKAVAADVKPIPNHNRHKWAGWDAYIGAADPDALFEEYRLAGATFRKPIHNNDDGLRGFEVIDSDGYLLFFGRPNINE